MGEIIPFRPRKDRSIPSQSRIGHSPAGDWLNRIAEFLPSDQFPGLAATLEFRNKIDAASQIRDVAQKQAAIIAASQEGYTTALGLEGNPLGDTLRRTVVETLTLVLGVKNAAAYIERWRIHHEALLRQNHPEGK